MLSDGDMCPDREVAGRRRRIRRKSVWSLESSSLRSFFSLFGRTKCNRKRPRFGCVFVWMYGVSLVKVFFFQVSRRRRCGMHRLLLSGLVSPRGPAARLRRKSFQLTSSFPRLFGSVLPLLFLLLSMIFVTYGYLCIEREVETVQRSVMLVSPPSSFLFSRVVVYFLFCTLSSSNESFLKEPES